MQLSGERLLVVEDEYFIADDMVTSLKRLGAEVVGPVASLTDARAMLGTRDDITGAILDINLQGELVYPLAEGLDRRGIPFIFTTGYGQADIPPRFAHIPRWEKPYDLELLVLSWAKRPHATMPA